ncbi:hypothetical protein AAGG74_18670 [Bacillus mexicanus]|uniref:hypothetical protein n=1 Tax=Bacillus mexicanus TaxID=2834415 RepID=UPI003D1AD26B
MKTKLTKDDLLKNVSGTLKKLEELKFIDEQISKIYQGPLLAKDKKKLVIAVNVGWVVLFTLMAIEFPGYHLLLMPILYYIFRGSKIAERVNGAFMKKHLEENEKLLEDLYTEKSEKEYELKTISMLEQELHDITMLRQFESYLKNKQAITIEKCIELYERQTK